MRFLPALAYLLAALAPGANCLAEDAQAAPDFVPQWLGAQYTGIDQHQFPLRSPYVGPLTLRAGADTEQTHTFGAYFGLRLPYRLQFYMDFEKFDGEGVSGATGMAGLTNGDVVRSGSVALKKRIYVARSFLRYQVPLGDAQHDVEAAQDQFPGREADRRLEFKFGKMAVSDDFDKNRYSNSPRTQFMNWSLWDNSAWDYAADTRGYTNGVMAGYIAPAWALRYGVYQMPTFANGQTLEWPLTRARSENLELTLDPQPQRWILRLLAYRNVARMGVYRDAIASAAAAGGTPDIRADDRDGRRKTGFGVNAEAPLADDGDTGLFARYGRNDGRTESFTFTEVDRNRQLGVQVSGAHWQRPDDRFGVACAIDGLSHDHRDYLAAGGVGFVLGDGRLNYGAERITELYYSAQLVKHVAFGPDLQLIENPGYNRDRGLARFAGLRLHVEL